MKTLINNFYLCNFSFLNFCVINGISWLTTETTSMLLEALQEYLFQLWFPLNDVSGSQCHHTRTEKNPKIHLSILIVWSLTGMNQIPLEWACRVPHKESFTQNLKIRKQLYGGWQLSACLVKEIRTTFLLMNL